MIKSSVTLSEKYSKNCENFNNKKSSNVSEKMSSSAGR
jgi:hypothetical protein